MKLRSDTNSVSTCAIAVVGGMTMDLVFEAKRMPRLGESLDASSLAYKPGGKGSNTSVAIYRAQHNKPIDKPAVAVERSVEKPNDKTIRQPGGSSGTSTEVYANGADIERIEVGVYLNTAIGEDAFGGQLKKNLEKNGVDVSGVRTLSNETTGTCAVFVEKYTGQSRDIGYPGANTNWVPRYHDSVECLAGRRIPNLIVCHLETKRETVERVLETASKNDVETLLNPSPVTYIRKEELEVLEGWEKAAKYFLDAGVKNFVITLGAKGAYYATEDSRGHVAALKGVNVKDSTGAGDTFTGSYALEYVKQKYRGEWDIRKAVERGCKAAAKTMEQITAQESIPWADEIDPQ
ncbi:Ribokinase-like protein [Cadophora sp. DSE1049]|nr:Ribokinase-like protein [Cadophora sp. DSE1049]